MGEAAARLKLVHTRPPAAPPATPPADTDPELGMASA
jgi:hypothetical protein